MLVIMTDSYESQQDCYYVNMIAGGCRYEKSPLPLLAKTLESVPLTASSADSCWEQCLDLPPTSSGEECVAAEFSLGTCKGYLGDRLLSATVASSVDQPSIVKKCFNGE